MSHLVEFVDYKVQRVGKRVIQINEAYTPKIYTRCGYQEKRPFSQRGIACSNCGFQLDRDLNSAVSILAKFYLLKAQFEDLLHELSVNEESFFLRWKGFLRQIANGKTRGPYPTIGQGSADL